MFTSTVDHNYQCGLGVTEVMLYILSSNHLRLDNKSAFCALAFLAKFIVYSNQFKCMQV